MYQSGSRSQKSESCQDALNRLSSNDENNNLVNRAVSFGSLMDLPSVSSRPPQDRRHHHPASLRYNYNARESPSNFFRWSCGHQVPMGTQHVDDYDYQAYHDDEQRANMEHVTAESLKGAICAEFVEEYFKCPVCLDILIESTGLSCGHRFCRECLNNWLRIKETCPCPGCRKPVHFLARRYDDDQAICSVISHLPPEWQAKRRFLQEYRSYTYQLSSPVGFLVKQGAKKCLIIFGRYASAPFRALRDVLSWFEEPSCLVGIFVGIIIACFIAVLWFTSDDYVRFIQYLTYAMQNYDKNKSLKKQIAVLSGTAERGRFQQFIGLDTLFARFIRLFYGWGKG